MDNVQKSKKVLIVASVISFIEWFNKENVEYLNNNLNCEVHIACNFDYMEDTDVERTLKYIELLKKNKIVLHNINFARSPLKLQNFHVYKELKKIINDNNFDLIHCHTPTASIITRLASKKARRNGSVVMYTCHGFHFHKSSPKKNWLIYYPVEQICSYLCDYIVTINKEDFEMAKRMHSKNVRYIPGVGVDISNIQNTKVDKAKYKESLEIPKDSIVIISIGELIERKNHEVVIKALATLKLDNVYYLICGKGPLKGYLEELAIKLGIGDKVKFLGFRKDIPELCNISDFSAFPSKIEGLGLAGIEALSAGIPIVSSNVHGIVDYVIDGKTGFSCNPNDINAFANAIDKLVSDINLREGMREKCIEVVNPYKLDNALRAMWDIYDEILK